MSPQDFQERLARTFEDRRLSRGECQDLQNVLAGLAPDADRRALRHFAFELARNAPADSGDGLVLDWLEDVVKALDAVESSDRSAPISEAYFSPGEDCPRAIIRLMQSARRTADVCVFTITDDRLSSALLDAHHRGVAFRVITDNDKAFDEGSDVDRIRRAGVPLRVDRTRFHMHHKFAVIDGQWLLSGSYNWTRGASRDNEENLIVTSEPRLVASYKSAFERLWADLA
jgi:phosphatidylserine/phosphatidylglycerophosphate/cardiolipin synthase-like enzyme